MEEEEVVEEKEEEEVEEENEEEVEEEEDAGDVEVIEPKKEDIKTIKRLCRLVLLRLKQRVSLKWYSMGWDLLQFWRVPNTEIGQQPSSESWCSG
jgi:hypothetical protein